MLLRVACWFLIVVSQRCVRFCSLLCAWALCCCALGAVVFVIVRVVVARWMVSCLCCLLLVCLLCLVFGVFALCCSAVCALRLAS